MSWGDVTEGGGGEGNFLKIKAGGSAKVHVLNSADGPKSFHSVYFQAINRGAIIDPKANPLAGLDDEYKLRKRHAFIVYDYASKEVGVFVCSNQTAFAIKGIIEEYGGTLDEVDVKITRTGDGLNTKYQVIPVKSQFNDGMIEGKDMPDMEEIFKITPDEDVEKMRNGELPDGDLPPVEDDAPPPPAKKAPAKGKPGKPAPEPTEEAPEDAPPAAPEDDAPPAAEEETPPPAKKAAPAANTRAGMLAEIKTNFANMSRYENPKQQLVDIQWAGGKKVQALSQLTTEQLEKLLNFQLKN